MRQITWILAIVMSIALVLSGCGTKGASDVVKDLDRVVGKMESYQGSGTMQLNLGQDAQKYQVEIWYKNPHYYRISLTNDAKDITQIVLRNDDGVFVLTPHLNKMFRFQSDWPEKSGQVYLFQSLVQSIVMDQDRQFTTDKDAYVFDVVANYQNGSLARQKIWLNKKSLAPTHVEVSDEQTNVMVVMDFKQFEFGKKFEKDSFDMQRNMTASKLESLPVMATVNPVGEIANSKQDEGKKSDEGKKDTGKQEPNKQEPSKQEPSKQEPSKQEPSKQEPSKQEPSKQEPSKQEPSKQEPSKQEPSKQDTGKPGSSKQPNAESSISTNTSSSTTANPSTVQKTAAATKQGFGVIDPSYMPQGVKKQDVSDVKFGEENAVLLRYSGKYNYSLLGLRPQEKTVSSLPGDIMDLGYTLGVVTGEDKKTLTWTYDGVEFRLSSADLTNTEMIKIAQSVQGQMGK